MFATHLSTVIPADSPAVQAVAERAGFIILSAGVLLPAIAVTGDQPGDREVTFADVLRHL